MLTPLPDLPEGVLGFRLSGRLTTDDYEETLMPAVALAKATGEGLRVVLQIDADAEFSAGALWDDTRLGLANWGRWKRVAVVCDEKWLHRVARAFSFLLPGQMRGFPADRLEQATAWAAATDGGLHVTLTPDLPPIAMLEPGGRLTKEDFADAANVLDPLILEHGRLAGLLIVAEAFPGWDSFGALLAHLRFVRQHHAEVGRVAVCSAEGSGLARLTGLAEHFVAAELRAFPIEAREEALTWLRAGATQDAALHEA